MGVVAMFGDMTYEGARGLVGPYLGLLGASALSIGFLAGLGEFLGYGLRFVTGWLGDRTRAYWAFVFVGYSANFLVVTGLAFADSWQAAAAFLLLERVGKAIRSPSKSTLVSYAAKAGGVGTSFGIEEALDQVGAVSGPLLAALVIRLLRAEPALAQYRGAFLVLVIPVVFNLACLAVARRRYPNPEAFEDAVPAPAAEHFSMTFHLYVAAAALVGLGFADWALVAFHAAKHSVWSVTDLPLVYAGVMAVDGFAALAAGWAFDRRGVHALAASAALSAGFAPCVFLAPSPEWVLAGAALWGVGMGAQDSVFKAAIATLVPRERRARAYGIFFGVFGLTWWVGSTLMGWLYERSLPGLVLFSVAAQLLGAVGLVLVGRRAAGELRGSVLGHLR
jgi:MFS family permease